jgi:hypothetical protein
MTVVFVVTTAADVFSTWVASWMEVLLNSKTFFGALSNGFKITFEPVLGHVSIVSVLASRISPASSEAAELPELRLDSEQDSGLVDVDGVLVPLVVLFLSEVPISVLTRAERTSGGREVHAARIETERVAVGFIEDTSSLLKAKIKKHRGTSKMRIQKWPMSTASTIYLPTA